MSLIKQTDGYEHRDRSYPEASAYVASDSLQYQGNGVANPARSRVKVAIQKDESQTQPPNGQTGEEKARGGAESRSLPPAKHPYLASLLPSDLRQPQHCLIHVASMGRWGVERNVGVEG